MLTTNTIDFIAISLKNNIKLYSKQHFTIKKICIKEIKILLSLDFLTQPALTNFPLDVNLILMFYTGKQKYLSHDSVLVHGINIKYYKIKIIFIFWKIFGNIVDFYDRYSYFPYFSICISFH